MDSNLQNKLQEFSATPPEGVWEKIADVLDAHEGYGGRLYHYEEQPPTITWRQIEENLAEATTPGRVVPFMTRFKKPLRYLAAASLIGVLLVTITLTVRHTEAGALRPGSNTTVPESAPASAAGNVAEQAEKNPVPETVSSEFGEGSSKTDPQETAHHNNNHDDVLAGGEQKTPAKTSRSAGVYSSMNNYVLFTDGDGRQRRVSKKLADLVKCKDGDGSCQQRLRQLRQKMAASAMTTDFTGILEMLRQLQ